MLLLVLKRITYSSFNTNIMVLKLLYVCFNSAQ